MENNIRLSPSLPNSYLLKFEVAKMNFIIQAREEHKNYFQAAAREKKLNTRTR